MRSEFNFSETTELMVALDHYKQLANHVAQIDTEQRENLESIWKEDGKYEGKYWNSPVVKHWNEIDIHITSQMWGSTACGWGGMGGAAMTSNYNYIIHQKYTDLLYVYWNGKLAYIVKRSEIADLSRMPSLSGSTQRDREINFIYKNKNRK